MFNYVDNRLEIKNENDLSSYTSKENDFNATTGLKDLTTYSMLPKAYLGIFGFFTSITIAVSVNTLAVAAIDRFVAIYRPLKYRTTSTILIARGACVGIWFFVVCVSLLPFWLDDIMYVTEHTSLVFAEGDLAIYTYMLTFCIPLIVLWFFTLASYVAYKKHYNSRKKIISNELIRREMKKHIKLMITLGIMAGAFTVTMIPSIAFISHLFLDDEEFFELLSLSRQNPVNYFQFAEVGVTILYLANSLTNFFVYSARDKRFRQTSKSFYLKIFGKIAADARMLVSRTTD